MSVVVYGKRLCGQVDRLPGQFYVSTQFFHVDYVPLFPLKSFIVVEGSEHEGGFQGKPIPLQWKSVLVGYARGLLAATAVFASLVAGFATTAFYVGHDGLADFALAIGAAALLTLMVWFVASTQRLWFVVVQAAFHGLSLLAVGAVLLTVQLNPGMGEDKANELGYLPVWGVANAALFLYSLTRLFSGASAARREWLAKELGYQPEMATAVDA